jgi:topoisomerase IA-like protein
MPFKSKAQRRKFAELLVNGKISDQTYEEWNRSTGKKELPERLHPEAGAKRTTKKKTTAKRTAAKRKTTVKKTPRTKKRTARKS